uniref:Mitofilin n=1 Tax=Chrysotila carterae TaxID=13221 RepID=A0A7S4B6J3_CHRCT|mmetsp:Transcript_5172/g.11238  ORF Transcript_5172/g.11238 Transcript_5172/m.11238 type:complete len:419 (-) Transcript_5172:857-2113(-)
MANRDDDHQDTQGTFRGAMNSMFGRLRGSVLGIHGAAVQCEAGFPEKPASVEDAVNGTEQGDSGELEEATSELQRKVEHLKALLEDRAALDAEAWRVQKAVQHQEEADAEKLMELLRAHEQSYAVDLEETKAEIEARIVLRMREEQEMLAAKYDEQLEALEEAYTMQLQHAAAAADTAAQQSVERAILVKTAELSAVHDSAFLKERQAHSQKLNEMQLEVDALAAAWSYDSRYKRTSHAAHQLSAAVFSLEETLAGRSNIPLKEQCNVLASVAARLDDPLLDETCKRLNEITLDAPTLTQLQARFKVAARAGRVGALVPENSGLWGYALASVASTLSFAGEALPANGARSEAAAVLSRAERRLDEGALAEAVAEVRTLRGPPRALCAGWLEAAEQRLLMEQVLTTAKAEASLAVSAMS